MLINNTVCVQYISVQKISVNAASGNFALCAFSNNLNAFIYITP